MTNRSVATVLNSDVVRLSRRFFFARSLVNVAGIDGFEGFRLASFEFEGA